MKTLRNLLFALIALVSIMASPVWASADSGEQSSADMTKQDLPDCYTNADDCVELLDRYFEAYGPPPEPTPEPAMSTNIEMTGGNNNLPQEVVVQMHTYEGELHRVTQNFCTNQEWQDIIDESIDNGFYEDRQDAIDEWSTYTGADDEVGYQAIYGEYFGYLQQQAAKYNVPSRPPTMWELIQQYPGCDEGNYETPSK